MWVAKASEKVRCRLRHPERRDPAVQPVDGIPARDLGAHEQDDRGQRDGEEEEKEPVGRGRRRGCRTVQRLEREEHVTDRPRQAGDAHREGDAAVAVSPECAGKAERARSQLKADDEPAVHQRREGPRAAEDHRAEVNEEQHPEQREARPRRLRQSVAGAAGGQPGAAILDRQGRHSHAMRIGRSKSPFSDHKHPASGSNGPDTGPVLAPAATGAAAKLGAMRSLATAGGGVHAPGRQDGRIGGSGAVAPGLDPAPADARRLRSRTHARRLP
jgi:hypothetical protein